MAARKSQRRSPLATQTGLMVTSFPPRSVCVCPISARATTQAQELGHFTEQNSIAGHLQLAPPQFPPGRNLICGFRPRADRASITIDLVRNRTRRAPDLTVNSPDPPSHPTDAALSRCDQRPSTYVLELPSHHPRGGWGNLHSAIIGIFAWKRQGSPPNRSKHNEANPPEPRTSFQGESGIGCHQG